jgi:hypothetical protein
MCTPWKASALKKAVRAACTVPTHPFFRYVECDWSSAVQTLGHIRDDMSGPSVGHIPLRNSYAIAKFFLVTEWGSLLCGAFEFFPHEQFACSTPFTSIAR